MALMPGAAPPGAPPGGAGPPGMMKSPIGGPSGPGASPMVSPGTGAGMQAQGKQRVSKVIDQLLEIGAGFPKDGGEWNAISRAISALNGVFTAAKKEPEPKPLPVPPTTPGAGLGGLGGPPSGMPPPGGGASPGGMPAGGPPPIAPEM
jgi:hypothetical protein